MTTDKLVDYFLKIDLKVRDLAYGNITGHSFIRGGLPYDGKAHLVLSKRKKYNIGKEREYTTFDKNTD